MTKVTLHESYVLVETDDISFTDLRAAVALYNNIKAQANKEHKLANTQLEILDPVKAI